MLSHPIMEPINGDKITIAIEAKHTIHINATAVNPITISIIGGDAMSIVVLLPV